MTTDPKAALKADIVRIAHWKQLAADHDKKGVLRWHLPNVAASSERIARAESAAGMIFSSDYRDFLACANGWRGFHVAVDLFGTEDFLAGRAAKVMQTPELADFVAASGWRRGEIIPIGASDRGLDVFLHVSPSSSKLPGGVVWYASEEVDRYGTFRDFLAAMVNYSARIAKKLSGEL